MGEAKQKRGLNESGKITLCHHSLGLNELFLSFELCFMSFRNRNGRPYREGRDVQLAPFVKRRRSIWVGTRPLAWRVSTYGKTLP